MKKNDVIQLFVRVNEMKPEYFRTVTKEKKLQKVESWYSYLKDYTFKSVLHELETYIKERNRVPNVEEVIENAELEDSVEAIHNPKWWYARYGKGKEPILINQSLYEKVFDWNEEHQCWGCQLLPSSLLDRIRFDPSMNTEKEEAERQRLLKIALEKQGEE